MDKTLFGSCCSAKPCLIIDSYSSHRNLELFSIEGKTIAVKIIPPGATPIIQPLDVFFFRQWKSFTKKFTDRVLLDNSYIGLHNRNTIITLHGLIHNQFSSPRFKSMIRYAWKKSGFLIEIDAFDHPNHVIFDTLLESCFNANCYSSSFIQCSWCRKHLRLAHFFDLPHYCQELRS